MNELIKSLPTVLRAVGSSPEVIEAAALVAWKHGVGEGLQNHAIATKLNAGTLIVEVRDAIWQKQLRTMKEQLLFRVNSVLGQAIVKDIELQVNPQVAFAAQPKSDEPREIADNEIPFDLLAAASAIQDRQLRQKFIKAAMATLKRRSATDLHG